VEHLVLATYPITNGCNITCPWCAHSKTQPIFNTRYVLGALSRIPHPIHGVALTGGEPFSCPDLLKIKAELEANGHRVFSITNGTLHDHIFEFVTGNQLDVALSIHNPAIFPEWITTKKEELISLCREKGLKLAAGLFSVDNETDIAASVEYIKKNRDAFSTATISTVYRKDIPAMTMQTLLDSIMEKLEGATVTFFSTGKTVVEYEGFSIVLRRSPTREEYNADYDDTMGCLFLSCLGEFAPVAVAQYINEEMLA
jgi:hypothetical protein